MKEQEFESVIHVAKKHSFFS